MSLATVVVQHFIM